MTPFTVRFALLFVVPLMTPFAVLFAVLFSVPPVPPFAVLFALLFSLPLAVPPVPPALDTNASVTTPPSTACQSRRHPGRPPCHAT
ncbi:hypothetical protein J2797_003822 [Paraburkholderia terricola]|uniref:hypothetical protein n=1 Tax=Paraburkholderia terricola TaxID=169427 RepID=UPI00285A3243|nr:hypothetical protein [Paraburkholderia terricola]MDR6493919.1 hypothetical protein [Paraburkholderia terricola]